jgi:hypothetical protein
VPFIQEKGRVLFATNKKEKGRVEIKETSHYIN